MHKNTPIFVPSAAALSSSVDGNTKGIVCARSAIHLTSYCAVYVEPMQSAGERVAVGLKCMASFNMTAECLKACKAPSGSLAHVTLCPCGQGSSTVLSQFALNTLKALCVPVMSNQVLNQASHELMMMSCRWWNGQRLANVTSRETPAAAAILDHVLYPLPSISSPALFLTFQLFLTIVYTCLHLYSFYHCFYVNLYPLKILS